MRDLFRVAHEHYQKVLTEAQNTTHLWRQKIKGNQGHSASGGRASQSVPCAIATKYDTRRPREKGSTSG